MVTPFFVAAPSVRGHSGTDTFDYKKSISREIRPQEEREVPGERGGTVPRGRRVKQGLQAAGVDRRISMFAAIDTKAACHFDVKNCQYREPIE